MNPLPQDGFTEPTDVDPDPFEHRDTTPLNRAAPGKPSPLQQILTRREKGLTWRNAIATPAQLIICDSFSK